MWTVLATQGSLGTALDLSETLAMAGPTLEAAYGTASASVWAVLGAYDWVGTTMFSPKSWHSLLVVLGFCTSVIVAVRLGSAVIFGFRVSYARGGITGMFFYVLGLGQFASVMVSYAHYGIRTAQSVPPSMSLDPDAAYTSADTQDFSPHTLVLEQFWRRLAGVSPPLWTSTVWEQLGPAAERVRLRIPPEDAPAAMEWSSRQYFSRSLAANSSRPLASWRALGQALLQFPGGGVELAHTTEAPDERAAPQGCLTAPGEERELSPFRWRDIDDQW